MNLVLFCYESESHLVASDSATSWTIAHQALLSMGFPSQEYWTRLPFPSPRDLPDPGIEPGLLLWRQSLYSLNTRATLSVYGKMQKSGLIEVIPLIYTSAIWNWYPVLFYPEFPQGLPTGHPLFTDMASNIFHSQVIIYYIYNIDFPKWLSGNESTCNTGNTGDIGLITALERPLEEEMVTHFSILAQKILWTEEPGQLESMRSQRIGHHWADARARAHTHTHKLHI